MAEFEYRDFSNPRGQAVVDVVRTDAKEVFLTIRGETAFQIGYDVCDTCSYFFKKVPPAQGLADAISPATVRALSDSLKDMRRMPNEATLAQFGILLPTGAYTVALATLQPELTVPGDAKDYLAAEVVATWGVDPYYGVADSSRTPYYRLGSSLMGAVEYGGEKLGVVVGVPLYPPTQTAMNKQEIIDQYVEIFRNRSASPTVLGLALVDDRGPATWGEKPKYTRHLIVTVFILDGHHKIRAADLTQCPVQVLLFIPHTYLGRELLVVPDALNLLSTVSDGATRA